MTETDPNVQAQIEREVAGGDSPPVNRKRPDRKISKITRQMSMSDIEDASPEKSQMELMDQLNIVAQYGRDSLFSGV